MGTRSVFARPIPGEPGHWEGRYCHWDGYPTHIVPAIFELLESPPIGGDLDALLRYVIDEHPGGWSSFPEYGFVKGFVEDALDRERREAAGDQCYCHGDRHEGWTGLSREIQSLSVDGTRRGDLMLSHVLKRTDPLGDAPHYGPGAKERPPYHEWAPTLDENGQEQYEPSDWGQEWLYIVDPADRVLRVFKWGSVGFFGMSAGSEISPAMACSLDEPCPDAATLEATERRGYAEAR